MLHLHVQPLAGKNQQKSPFTQFKRKGNYTSDIAGFARSHRHSTACKLGKRYATLVNSMYPEILEIRYIILACGTEVYKNIVAMLLLMGIATMKQGS